ncbi:hypothetical protein DM828_15725 [Pseudomonas umsongensis]|nr:hypothetical protein [Pseudomonas umsongensis]
MRQREGDLTVDRCFAQAADHYGDVVDITHGIRSIVRGRSL